MPVSLQRRNGLGHLRSGATRAPNPLTLIDHDQCPIRCPGHPIIKRPGDLMRDLELGYAVDVQRPALNLKKLGDNPCSLAGARRAGNERNHAAETLPRRGNATNVARTA